MSSARLQNTFLIYKKSILFVYGSNKQTEDTIKKTISFTIKSKK